MTAVRALAAGALVLAVAGCGGDGGGESELSVPLAQVGMRTAPNSKRGSCSISIDGVEVSGHSTNKSLGVVVCTG